MIKYTSLRNRMTAWLTYISCGSDGGNGRVLWAYNLDLDFRIVFLPVSQTVFNDCEDGRHMLSTQTKSPRSLG